MSDEDEKRSRSSSSSDGAEEEEEYTPAASATPTTEEGLKQRATRNEIKQVEESKTKQKARLKQIREAQNAQLAKEKKVSAEARLLFLQQQVEVFSHFTGETAASLEAAASLKKKKTAGGRTRMTEEEEDRQLLDASKHATRANRLTVQPGCIKFGTMRAYQIEGLNWMISLYDQGINGILADEMGLGKTLQSISLLGYLKFERGVTGPHMVLVPKAVISNWQREFERWCPDLRVVAIHGDKQTRQDLIASDLLGSEFDVCITTFEVLMIEATHFKKFKWRYLIVDEAHRLKSETSKTSQMVRELDTQFRLLVTGTPLQNNLHELWALLNFLLPEVFGDSQAFEEYFKFEDMKEDTVVSKLHAILRPFMLRRLKADVEKSLPPKREIKLYTGMSEMQEYWYKTVLNRDVAVLNQLGGPDRSRLLNILMQLRKVCNHPYLFQGAEPGPPYFDGPHLWENCGKLFLVDKLLTKLKANGDRVLIFSQMTRMLDILEDYMRVKGYEYCRIDGSSKGEDRDSEMDAFNAPDSTKFCFLLSTRAGGLGINLATANVVILYDSDWNPQMDLQAQDRAHRIGQKKQVTVFRLITEGTVEEKIVERAEKKLYLDAVVVQQGRLQQQNSALSKNELMNMVKFGAESIFRQGGSKISDEDIDAILERDSKRTEETNQKFKTDVQHTLSSFKFESELDESVLLLSADPNASTGAGGNFIDLPSRTGRAKRGEEEEAPAGGAGAQPAKPRGMVMHDFQFFNQAAIRAIEDQEYEFAQRRKTQAALIKEAKLAEESNGSAEAGGNAAADALQEEMQTMFIPEHVQEEKQRLISEAFSTWQKKDFRIYVNALEKFGREATAEVFAMVAEQTQRDEEEIARYHEVFWERGPSELQDWDKLLDRVTKGENKIKKRSEIDLLLQRKVASCPANPFQCLQMEYGATKGKIFTEDEDRFLVCKMHQLGFGNWEQLRLAVRRAWMFRFDWFFKSRSADELKRRCEVLIRMIEKEYEAPTQQTVTAAAAAQPVVEESAAGADKKRTRRPPAGRASAPAVVAAQEEEEEEAPAKSVAQPAKKRSRKSAD